MVDIIKYPVFQAYSEVNEVNVVQFYLGGVPESVEPEILSQLNLHKGFTGCILMNYAVTSQLSGQYQVNKSINQTSSNHKN